MVCCSLDPENPTKSCKSRGPNLRVHFKNTRETFQAIKGMQIRETTNSLKAVTLQKQRLPSRQCPGGVEGVPGSGHRAGGAGSGSDELTHELACHAEMMLTSNRLFLNQRRRLHRRKRYPS